MKPQKPRRPRDTRDNRDNRCPAKATPTPSDLSVDDPHNWDFASLPPEEQQACCRWEYARESAFIRSLQQRYQDPTWKQQPNWNDKRDAAKYRQRVFTIASDLDRLRQRGELETKIAAELTRPPAEQCFPRPWLALTDAERKARIVPPAATVPAFERGSYAHADIISASAEHRAHTMPLPSDATHPVCLWNDAPSSILYEEAGEEVGVFRIGWGNWTDLEIKRAFARWVDKNRPPDFRKPKGRPRGAIDPAAALRCLAIMRVLHAHTLHDLSYRFASVNTTKPRRDRERARAIFQTLSPLGAAEVPLSWRMMDK